MCQNAAVRDIRNHPQRGKTPPEENKIQLAKLRPVWVGRGQASRRGKRGARRRTRNHKTNIGLPDAGNRRLNRRGGGERRTTPFSGSHCPAPVGNWALSFFTYSAISHVTSVRLYCSQGGLLFSRTSLSALGLSVILCPREAPESTIVTVQ